MSRNLRFDREVALLRSRCLVAMGLSSALVACPKNDGGDVSVVTVPTLPSSDGGAAILERDASTASLRDRPREPPPPPPDTPPQGYDVSFKQTPGQSSSWCPTGSARCYTSPEANQIVDPSSTGSIGSIPSCPQAVVLHPCPCPTGSICNSGGSCTLPLQLAVTRVEMPKKGDVCCYELPTRCVPPFVGRAFRGVSGEPILAEISSNEGWHRACDMGFRERARAALTELRAACTLSEVELARLGDEWLRAARGEHASIASFARVTLQLLALGAPASLIRLTQEAALDEVRHAEQSYVIASTLLERPCGPGRLSVEAVSSVEASLAALVRETFFDACIEETCGALQARERSARAPHPLLAKILEEIADDEVRHAELAWRTLTWAFQAGGESARAALRDSLTKEIRTARAFGGDSTARAFEEIVRPCAERLIQA